MKDTEYLTKEKFDEFTQELQTLRSVKRKEVAEQLEYAKSLGDLSENAEYHEARNAQADVEDRITKLELLLKHAVIVSGSHTGSVNVGSVVTVEKDGKSVEYTIVGSEEADVASSKISIKSLFGQAIFGKKEGDDFSYDAPSGQIKYKIIKIK